LTIECSRSVFCQLPNQHVLGKGLGAFFFSSIGGLDKRFLIRGIMTLDVFQWYLRSRNLIRGAKILNELVLATMAKVMCLPLESLRNHGDESSFDNDPTSKFFSVGQIALVTTFGN